MCLGSQKKAELWPESGQVFAFPLGRNIQIASCELVPAEISLLLQVSTICKMKTTTVSFIILMRERINTLHFQISLIHRSHHYQKEMDMLEEITNLN